MFPVLLFSEKLHECAVYFLFQIINKAAANAHTWLSFLATPPLGASPAGSLLAQIWSPHKYVLITCVCCHVKTKVLEPFQAVSDGSTFSVLPPWILKGTPKLGPVLNPVGWGCGNVKTKQLRRQNGAVRGTPIQNHIEFLLLVLHFTSTFPCLAHNLCAVSTAALCSTWLHPAWTGNLSLTPHSFLFLSCHIQTIAKRSLTIQPPKCMSWSYPPVLGSTAPFLTNVLQVVALHPSPSLFSKSFSYSPITGLFKGKGDLVALLLKVFP